MRVRTDDGVELEVRVEGSGPAILMIHGHGGAKEDFADHLDRLAANHTVVTFDHRGHGESDHPEREDAYSIARMRADAWAVADALELDRLRVLGHSLGGMVARRMPLEQPGRVEALVLMDTTPGPVPGITPVLADAAADVGMTQGKDALKALLDSVGPLDTPAYRRMIETQPGYQAFQDRKWANTSVVMWATLAREIARQADDLLLLAEISCPTLVLVGELDVVFVAPSQAMAETIPGARIVVHPGAGHSPQFENPQHWIGALEGFLSDLSATVS